MSLFNWSKKQTIDDVYAKKHANRVINGMSSKEALNERWNNEIIPLISENMEDIPLALWTAEWFFDNVTIPSQNGYNIRDDQYHIANSRYALLDFCIYCYFKDRANLEPILDPDVIEEIDIYYTAITISYFASYFGFSRSDVLDIFEMRTNKYEFIIHPLIENDFEEELLSAVCNFMVHDFNNSPLSEEHIITEFNHHHFLSSEIKSCSAFCTKLLATQLEKLSKSRFSSNYIDIAASLRHFGKTIPFLS